MKQANLAKSASLRKLKQLVDKANNNIGAWGDVANSLPEKGYPIEMKAHYNEKLKATQFDIGAAAFIYGVGVVKPEQATKEDCDNVTTVLEQALKAVEDAVDVEQRAT